MSERWDSYFLRMALLSAGMSKDPSTKVGAVIVGDNRNIVSVGFNGFPIGVEDTDERLNDRDTKLGLVVHAEMNAVLQAAQVGHRLDGCELYVIATDKSGDKWGGAPCVRCLVEMIHAGISSIVSLPMKTSPSRWHESLKISRALIDEVGIRYREVSVESLNL